MRQQTLAEGSFEKFRKKTRKELFLDDMEQIIPWRELYGVIQHMQGRNRYCVRMRRTPKTLHSPRAAVTSRCQMKNGYAIATKLECAQKWNMFSMS